LPGKRESGDIRSLFRAALTVKRKAAISILQVATKEQGKGCSMVNEYLANGVEKYPLRSFKACHLASATAFREHIADDFLFACFDSNLLHAARSEGMKTFP
jgi:hypothetical protein